MYSIACVSGQDYQEDCPQVWVHQVQGLFVDTNIFWNGIGWYMSWWSCEAKRMKPIKRTKHFELGTDSKKGWLKFFDFLWVKLSLWRSAHSLAVQWPEFKANGNLCFKFQSAGKNEYGGKYRWAAHLVWLSSSLRRCREMCHRALRT